MMSGSDGEALRQNLSTTPLCWSRCHIQARRQVGVRAGILMDLVEIAPGESLRRLRSGCAGSSMMRTSPPISLARSLSSRLGVGEIGHRSSEPSRSFFCVPRSDRFTLLRECIATCSVGMPSALILPPLLSQFAPAPFALSRDVALPRCMGIGETVWIENPRNERPSLEAPDGSFS